MSKKIMGYWGYHCECGADVEVGARAAQNRIRDIYPDTYIVDNETGKVVE